MTPMKNWTVLIVLLGLSVAIHAQKKKMTPEVYDLWNRIENVTISSDGDWVSYTTSPGKGDKTMHLYNTRNGKSINFERSHSARFDFENNFITFKISIPHDSLQSLKLKKTKKDKLPKDTLGVYSLKFDLFDKISDVEKYDMPLRSGGLLAVKIKGKTVKKDSTLVKDENSQNGEPLLIYDYVNDTIYSYGYIKDHRWADEHNTIVMHGTGSDSLKHDHITMQDFVSGNKKIIHSEKGEYFKLSIDQNGKRIGFIADTDTTKVKPRPHDVYIWRVGEKKAKKIADNENKFIPEGWEISKNGRFFFAEEADRYYFNIAPIAAQEDSTILEEDKANVEIWNYKDPMLYTQQNKRSKREKERSYTVMYDLENKKFLQLNDIADSEIRVDSKNKHDYFLSYDEKPYQQNISWLGYAHKDLYLTNIRTGKKDKIATRIAGNPRLSPNAKYVYWYSRPDTAWISYKISTKELKHVTKGSFYDEQNDRPADPRQSGFLKWTEDDRAMLLYDHYDIWKVDPNGMTAPSNLTNGRQYNTRMRHLSLDRDIIYFPEDTTILLKQFNDITKKSGYATLDLKNKIVKSIEEGDYNYATRIIKAENSNDIIFTKENFQTFPDLIHTTTAFTNQKKVSNANPQQSDYIWGNIEMVEWKDYDGESVKGLLVKPEDFDPNKKYPMMVNFYEKNSDRLYNHRAPYPHRSTINYSYWTNKGYIIFNPDIKYKNGYPGQSAYDAVISGVEAMIEEHKYIDKDRIGVQGHSWGGYQIAHLITKTDIFKCAEAGAPVVNMVSAYGGIRWGTGMSRMFQYEQTQSRLGATLWEEPQLYMENSPIFNLDKINTPVLILHNDKDGAVPWYQGIEFFVGMRRLGKPAWMLNYNDEPHWPLKRPNRLDFNKRMEQFFDHYLMDAPMPEWMDKGVPAVEKGVNYGFELDK